MRILLTGATGMVGDSVLGECLDDPRVTQVLAVGRKPSRIAGDKRILENDDINRLAARAAG
jgi:thioester reductase-like protein